MDNVIILENGEPMNISFEVIVLSHKRWCDGINRVQSVPKKWSFSEEFECKGSKMV